MPEDAVLDAVDTSADDGAQDDGTQDDGLDAAAVDDSRAIDDATADDEPADDADASADDDAVAKDDEPVTPDGRKMPDGLKKAIASLKTTSPEVAKQIKGLYYSEQAYREVFPKPEEAIAAKTLIEEVGGAEGIQQITAERQEWQEIDQSFGEGKPEFVKGLAESNPEAFLKTAPHVINEYAARAPEQYQYYANNVAVNTLASAGVSLQGLANAYNQYGDGTGKETPAQSIIAEIHGALAGLKKQSTEYEQKRNSVDPERQKLQQEKTQFETDRRADFETKVDADARKGIAEKMQPEIARIVGNRKVDPEAMKGYQKMVADAIDEMLEAVPGMKDKLEAHYRTGDKDKSVKFILSQVDRLLPNAAKVIDPYVRNIPASGKPAPKPAANGNGTARTASPGEVVLKDMPDWDKFDQSKTTVADVMMGHGILKNGKKASGWV